MRFLLNGEYVMDRQTVLIIYGIYIGVLSLITFIVYGIDKIKAKYGVYRISEKTLLTLSMLGGAVGGYIAMNLFRHKTASEHWYFSFLNLLGVVLYGVLAYCIAFVFNF